MRQLPAQLEQRSPPPPLAGGAQQVPLQPAPSLTELRGSIDQLIGPLDEVCQWEGPAHPDTSPPNMEADAARSMHSTPSAAAALTCSASGSVAHGPLDALREGAWQAAADKARAQDAVLVAFAHATSQLPGSQPELLGVAPAVFVLLPGNLQRACPAGALLVQVHAPAGGCPASCESGDGSGMHQGSEAYSEGSGPLLRVLVYCPDSGALLERRDWLLREERQLGQHPLFGLPCWDSRDGWQLLFPDPRDEPHQAAMFAATIAMYGAAQSPPQGTPRFPLLPPASHSPSLSRSCDSLQLTAQRAQRPVQHAQQLEIPGYLELPAFSEQEACLLAEVLTAGDPAPPGELVVQPAEHQPPRQPPGRGSAKRKQAAKHGRAGGAPLGAQQQQAAELLALAQPAGWQQQQQQQPMDAAWLPGEPAAAQPPPLKLQRRAFTPPPPRLAQAQPLQQQRPTFAAPSRLQPTSPCGLGSGAFDSIDSTGAQGSQQVPLKHASGYMASANLSSGVPSGCLSPAELWPCPAGLPAFAGWASGAGSCCLPTAGPPGPLASGLAPAQHSAAWALQQPVERRPLQMPGSGGAAARTYSPPASPFAAAAQLPAFEPPPSRRSAEQHQPFDPHKSSHQPSPMAPAALLPPAMGGEQSQPVAESAELLQAAADVEAAFDELWCADRGPGAAGPAAGSAGFPAMCSRGVHVATMQPCIPTTVCSHAALGRGAPAATPAELAHRPGCCSPLPAAARRAAAAQRPPPATVSAQLAELLDWDDGLDASYRRAVVTLRNRAANVAARFRH